MDLAEYGQWLREHSYGLLWKVSKTASLLCASCKLLNIGITQLILELPTEEEKDFYYMIGDYFL